MGHNSSLFGNNYSLTGESDTSDLNPMMALLIVQSFICSWNPTLKLCYVPMVGCTLSLIWTCYLPQVCMKMVWAICKFEFGHVIVNSLEKEQLECVYHKINYFMFVQCFHLLVNFINVVVVCCTGMQNTHTHTHTYYNLSDFVIPGLHCIAHSHCYMHNYHI